MFISVIMLRGLVSELERRGFSRNVVLDRLGVTQERLFDGQGMTASEFGGLVEVAAHWLGDAGLGLAIAAQAPEHLLRPLGYLMFSASTVREAYGLLSAYSGLVASQLTLQLVEQGDAAELRLAFEDGPLSREGERFASEFAMAFVARVHAELSRRTTLTAACFNYAPPRHAERYAPMFSCPVQFGAPHTCLRFARDILDAPSVRAEPSVCALLTGVADKMLEQSVLEVSLEQRVRASLQRWTNLVQVDMDRLAAGLGFTVRGLRRRLQKDGTRLSKIVAEERCRIALRELGQADGPAIKEAAFSLGYSETTAFHRAFKRWTGETPGQFVRSARPVALPSRSNVRVSQTRRSLGS